MEQEATTKTLAITATKPEVKPEPVADGSYSGYFAVLAGVDAVPKNGYNKFQDYWYATVDDVYIAVRPLMAENCVGSVCREIGCKITASPDGKKNFMLARYYLALHDDKGVELQRTSGNVTIQTEYRGPQSVQAARSYAQKYWLRSTFLMETGDRDLDAEPQQNDNGTQVASAIDLGDMIDD